MTERKRTEKELRENCLAREIGETTCMYPNCDCFTASDYYEKHPEEL
jgi:citrate synthase